MGLHDPHVLVTVVGDTAKILVATDQAGLTSVDVKFDAYAIGDDQAFAPPQPGAAGAKPVATWTEALVFTKRASTRPSPKNVADELPHHFEADWIVGVESAKKAVPAATHYVVFTVRVGRVVSETYFRLPGFAVTTEPKLHEIMLHEFSKPGPKPQPGDDVAAVFDPSPLQKELDSLTVQQRKLLVSHPNPAKHPAGRLVTFITLRGTRRGTTGERPMYADTCGVGSKNKSVLGNATFSVYHCHKAGHRVTLVTHTEYFCVNRRNGETQTFFVSPGVITVPGAKAFRYLLVAWQTPHHDAVYHLVCTPSGRSIMKTNSLHGGINTVGCWMLFRNYNWPILGRQHESLRPKFLASFIRYRAKTNGLPEHTPYDDPRRAVARTDLKSDLASIGYNLPDTERSSSECGSVEKFWGYDQNFAYAFFIDRVLGLRFNSLQEDSKDQGPVYTNMHESSGKFVASFFRRNVISGNAYHRIHDKLKQFDKGWSPNELGFQTAKRTWYGNAPTEDAPLPDAEGASWGDLYFFAAPGVTGASIARESIES